MTGLTCKVGTTVAGIKGTNIGIGLLEASMLTRSNRQIANHVQGVSATGSPARDQCDNDLWHKANQALHLKNVQSTSGTRSVLVARITSNSLVAPGAKRPDAVLWRWSISGQQHNANIAGSSGVLKGLVKLVYGLRSKSISNFWTRKANPHNTKGVVTVVADVGQLLKTGN